MLFVIRISLKSARLFCILFTMIQRDSSNTLFYYFSFSIIQRSTLSLVFSFFIEEFICMISLLQTICKPLFGTFEREEFKKFLRMGLTFTCIIGSYWTLRTLKNALFCSLVGGAYLPLAKTASIICLVPLVMLYTKLLDMFSREKMFYMLSSSIRYYHGTFCSFVYKSYRHRNLS